jgi:16S rRNA (cytidine1402-2'-O)-methyltransferase
MLYLVPTPIGNLQDITLRAINLLTKAQFILTEDPRKTKLLFELLKITNQAKLVQLTKYHHLNLLEIERVREYLQKNPETVVCLLSDAGTPGISDPAVEVVRLWHQANLPVSTLPGATALIPAIVNSGLVSKEFLFLGFLPTKKGRQKIWQEIQSAKYPVVVYESVHRLPKFLQEVQRYLAPDRKVSYSREISKVFEQIWVGTVAELAAIKIISKGEFVWVIDKA